MDINEIIKEENLVYRKSAVLNDKVFNFCPGCGHGVVQKLIAEVVEEMNIESEVIGVGSVGCSVLVYEFMELDVVSAAHGRAAAVATGIKRVMPDKYVFSLQGDGDLAAIGTSESIHACNRGENITMIFINNGIYGMTGGQMAPTSLHGMKTATSPYGRNEAMGHPIRMSDVVAQLEGTYYVTRQAVHTPAMVRKAKKALRQAFENQKLNKGLSFVEFVTNCNSGWKLSPIKANQWLDQHMLPFYPLGDIKTEGVIVTKDK
ncbi:MAG: thiamine pyrophosphate-dependent enzyme [Bacteroidota bacterium]|nr:thiamine pyrophosphate-dependent enzyme [Bacteroidota bacterium]